MWTEGLTEGVVVGCQVAAGDAMCLLELHGTACRSKSRGSCGCSAAAAAVVDTGNRARTSRNVRQGRSRRMRRRRRAAAAAAAEEEEEEEVRQCTAEQRGGHIQLHEPFIS